MNKRRHKHSSLIFGNRYLLVLFGQDDKKVHDSIEYIDLKNPARFTELKLDFRKYRITQNWFSGCLIHHYNPEEFFQSGRAKILILGGLIDSVPVITESGADPISDALQPSSVYELSF